MYHKIEERGKKKYHYIVENIRIGKGKWKKIKIYLGNGDLSRHEIKALIEKNRPKLKLKVRNAKKKFDPLFSLLSDAQLRKLEEIKARYMASVSQADTQLRQNYYEGFVTEFTYDTSAIEGSSVTLEETSMILFDKIAPKGRKIEEIREIENHKASFDYTLSYRGDISRDFVLKLHKLLMHNVLWKYAGVFRDVQVIVRGAEFTPPESGAVEEEFKKLMNWYRVNKRRYNPVIVAAYFHFVFESIHPFRDGNGRVGRLLLNFILRKNGYPMINIKNSDKHEYYTALKEGNRGNLKPLADLIYGYLTKTRIWI